MHPLDLYIQENAGILIPSGTLLVSQIIFTAIQGPSFHSSLAHRQLIECEPMRNTRQQPNLTGKHPTTVRSEQINVAHIW